LLAPYSDTNKEQGARRALPEEDKGPLPLRLARSQLNKKELIDAAVMKKMDEVGNSARRKGV
jgi:hypothetical protein